MLSLQLCLVQGLSGITCMCMFMHRIQKVGQHASSAVSLMLSYLMVTVETEWCLDCVCMGHSIEHSDRFGFTTHIVLLCMSSSLYVKVPPKPADPLSTSRAKALQAVKIDAAALAILHLPQPSTPWSEVSGDEAESHSKVTSATMLRQQQQQQHAMLCMQPAIQHALCVWCLIKQCSNRVADLQQC